MKIANKKLIVALLLVTLLGAALPQFVNAQAAGGALEAIESIWGCATQPFSCATKGISLLINGFLALLIALVAGLMRIVLQFNDNVVNMPAVQAGFGVTLAIANLGFVLAIIAIALATILRSQTYGIKQLLWKLVVAAIVVNFSLVIAGAILGFSSSLTRYFVQGAVPLHGSDSVASAVANYGSFVNNITQAFGPQGAYGPPSLQKIAQDCGLEGTWKNYLCTVGTTLGTGLTSAALNQWLPGGFLSQIIASLMSTIFLLMIFFTFLAITVMLLIRFIYIAILLIMAPLVWLLWIFPNTKSNFSKWWSHFIKWTFFPPIVIFFLYLAILTGSRTNQSYLDNNSLPPAGTNPNDLPESAIMMSLKDAIGFNLIPQIEQGIILIGFAVGGLFAANYLSIVGAGVAMGLAKSAGGAVKGYAFKQGKGVVGERVRAMGTRRETTGQVTTAWQRLGSRLQGIPLGGGIGRAVARMGQAESPERVKEILKYQEENLSALTNDGLLATARRGTLNPMESAAIASELAKRNQFSSLAPAEQQRYLNVSERMGMLQNVLNNRPELAAQTSMATPQEITDPSTGARRLETTDEARARAIQDAVRKIKTANVEQIAHQSLGDYRDPTVAPTNDQMDVALRLSNPQLGRLGQEGDSRQIEAFRNTVRHVADRYSAGTLALTPEQESQLSRILDYTTESIHWQNII